MSLTIRTPWSRYGFLSNKYPSPFNARGRRWRNVEEFISSNGRDRETLLEGVTEKFKSNSHLLVELEGTGDMVILGDGDLPSVITEVRSLLSDRKTRETSSFKRMMISLADIIKKEGFEVTTIAGEEVDITDLPEGDHKIELFGPSRSGTIDLVLSDTITDKKIQSVITPYRSKGLDNLYILVGSLSRNTITRSLAAMSAFHQIRYFSKSELLIEYSKHILTPPVEIVTADDPIYTLPIGSLPEISSDDPFIRQLGIKPKYGKRLILAVKDHSPHYREVV